MTNCAGCNREVELVEQSTWLCQKCYSARLDKQRAHDDGYRVGVIDGERLERAAIVAWLRGMEFIDRVEHVLSKRIADWIERGEHLRGDE